MNPLFQTLGMSARGWVALGTGAVALTVIALTAAPVVRAVFISSGAHAPETVHKEEALRFREAATKKYLAQINGRSLFYIPPPPAPAPRPRVDPPPVVKVDPPKPLPPSRYGGPAIMGMVNNAVWFTDGTQMRVGDPVKSDLSVVDLSNAPWTAKLRWKEIDFDVTFIERDGVIHPRPELPKPEAPKLDASKPESPKVDASKPGVPGGAPVPAPSVHPPANPDGSSPSAPVIVTPPSTPPVANEPAPVREPKKS
jgi:hypothetical protein